MKKWMLVPVLALCAVASVSADVKQSAVDGFLVRHELTIAKPPSEVYRAFGQIGRWWNPDHSWSASAANLSLDLQAGGCLCERWEKNSVEHGRVVFAKPDALLRLRASLGPLQELGVAGVLTFELSPGGNGTTLVASYRVSGDSLHQLDKIAPAVDAVIGEQVGRLKAHVETERPDPKF